LSIADQRVADAIAHMGQGRFAEAELLLRTVLQDFPEHAEAWHRLGVLALSAGHAGDAEGLIARSLAIQPQNPQARVNHGVALHALGRFEDSLAEYVAASAQDSNLVSAWINRAAPLQGLGRIDEAVAVLEHAITLDAQRPEAFNNLGNLYKEQGRLRDALAAYDQALALNPLMQEAFSNRLAAIKLDPTCDPQENLAWHRKWSAWFEAVCSDRLPLANSPDKSRRLRIGYVSPDCHSAMPDFIRPVWRHHDPGRFEVVVYFNRAPDFSRLPAPGLARVMAGMSDAQVAEQIRADGIDILVDLAAHTGKNRLGVFARQPAPVQITWLDYLGTTGLRSMQYRITDAIADPPGRTEAFHTESLLRMPQTEWCWEPPSDAAPVSPLPALRNGWLTFGSFNNHSKLTDETLAIWRDLLRQLPDARLIVAGVPDGYARERLRAILGAGDERLTLLSRTDVGSYRELIGSVDIALDPTPFSGATTTLDALWQGVPVATVGGPHSWSRSTASILAALELKAWVFESALDMTQALANVARAPEALAELRAMLRSRVANSPLVDAASFTRSLEDHFHRVWLKWCDDNAAASRGANPKVFDQSIARIHALNLAGGHEEALALAMQACDEWPSAKALQAALVQAALGWSRAREVSLAPVPAPARTGISFIICSIRPDRFAAISAQISSLFADHEVEVIGIHDARSLTEGYNRGAGRARFGTLVFCHDDIEFVNPDFASRVSHHLSHADLIGVAGASALVNGSWGDAGPPHLYGHVIHPAATGGFVYLVAGLQDQLMTGATALDGLWMACRREVWERVRFDEETFDGFHLYDIDFSHRASLAGFKVAVAGDLLIQHFSTGQYDQRWQRYNQRFLAKFPALSNVPNVDRYSLNVKLASIDQVKRLQQVLLHWRYGLPRTQMPA